MTQKYWRMCLPEILQEYQIDLPSEQIEALADDIAHCAEMEGEAMGYHCIPSPHMEEIRQLKQKLQTAQEDARRREEIYCKDIARRVSPKLEPHNVGIKDGAVEIWDR